MINEHFRTFHSGLTLGLSQSGKFIPFKAPSGLKEEIHLLYEFDLGNRAAEAWRNLCDIYGDNGVTELYVSNSSFVLEKNGSKFSRKAK